MTPDELKSIPKGEFVVMKTGSHPMRTRLRLFLDWGITFGEPYQTPEHGQRKVYYAGRQELETAIIARYWTDPEKKEPAHPPQREQAGQNAGGHNQKSKPMVTMPKKPGGSDGASNSGGVISVGLLRSHLSRSGIEPPCQGGVHLPQRSRQQGGHLLAGDQYHRSWSEPVPLDSEAGAERFGEGGSTGKVPPLAGEWEPDIQSISAGPCLKKDIAQRDKSCENSDMNRYGQCAGPLSKRPAGGLEGKQWLSRHWDQKHPVCI